MNIFTPIVIAGLVAALLVFRADLRRRRLSLRRTSGWHLLSALDVACPAVTIGALAVLLVAAISRSQGTVLLYSPTVWRAIAGVLTFVFIWAEGRRQIQFQRPAGIVLGEWLILAGAYQLLESIVFGQVSGFPHGTGPRLLCILAIFCGAILIAVVVPPFMKGDEAYRILERVAEQGESVQAEWVPPTRECPHPEHWQMVDSQTSELEVLEFLKSVVMTVKPHLIVETGTFIGHSTIKMAEGLKANGFGRIITIEYDPAIFAKAKERIDASGLGSWIEYRNESSLETRIDGTIDILFSDSHLPIREQEIRRFLPQIDPRGLILVHDASSHFQVVRESALRLEQEGLLSVVLLPTPRGLVIAQKREGRK
ncbi:MAG TPA: class I SAM-dependent methyltransferase [Candidatus Acidoferrales bacterium]|nr:class I SAM-dependent methyltransferase [Candidatus Acidoferrales bacterium]